jgi:hypothetical protein
MGKQSVFLASRFTILQIVALLILPSCKQSDSETGFPAQTAYPGASFTIGIAPQPDTNGVAEHGKVVVAPDGKSYIYVAPLDASADTYRIINVSTGEQVAQGSVTTSMPAVSELELLEVTPGQQLLARYGDVQIEAVLNDGITTTSYRHQDGDEQISITFHQQQATLQWQDTELDGYGALTAAQAQTLHAMATGKLARALTMVPLDLGCIDRPFDVPGEIYAALLFPWQMILKYEVARREAVVRHFMSLSQCGFPGHLGTGQTRPPNIAVLWDADHSVPMVHEAFPFDGDGQMRGLPE